ncbi:MAG: metallophosphoesterase [Parabacteroides sp.]
MHQMTGKRGVNYKWVAGIVLIVAVGLWVRSRFDVWFNNLPEPPYQAIPAPGRILLTFGQGEALSRDITWQGGSVVEPSHVELVDQATEESRLIPATGELFASRSGEMAYYRTSLPHLNPDATYRYRVQTGEHTSDWHTFRTYNGATRDNFSFLYFGDVQDTLGGRFGDYLKEAFRQHPQTEFLLFGGDLTERPMDCYWEEAFRGLGDYATRCPILTVTGNHDYLKGVPMHLEHRFPLIFSYFLNTEAGSNCVYTLRYNQLQLFLLDSTRELPYLWQQRQWLERALRASEAQWKIVVIHHPLHSLKSKRHNLLQRWLFDDLIQQYGVDLVLQGHEHAFARQVPPEGEPGPAYLVSHCSTKCYSIQPGGRFDVYGLTGRYYQQLRLTPHHLTVETYDAVSGQLFDSFRIQKKPALSLTQRGGKKAGHK